MVLHLVLVFSTNTILLFVRGCVVLFSFALLLLLFCLCLQKPSPPHPAPQRGHASHNALQPAAAKHVSLWKKSSRCDVINCGLHTATLWGKIVISNRTETKWIRSHESQFEGWVSLPVWSSWKCRSCCWFPWWGRNLPTHTVFHVFQVKKPLIMMLCHCERSGGSIYKPCVRNR